MKHTTQLFPYLLNEPRAKGTVETTVKRTEKSEVSIVIYSLGDGYPKSKDPTIKKVLLFSFFLDV